MLVAPVLCLGGAVPPSKATELQPQWAPRYTSKERRCWSVSNFTAGVAVDEGGGAEDAEAVGAQRSSAGGGFECDAAHLMCSGGPWAFCAARARRPTRSMVSPASARNVHGTGTTLS